MIYRVKCIIIGCVMSISTGYVFTGYVCMCMSICVSECE